MKTKTSIPKLTTFIWQGCDNEGSFCQGEITSLNIRFAKVQLHNKGIKIKKLHRKFVIPIFKKRTHKIKNKDIMLLIRQLATLLLSGFPLLQALTAICFSCENIAVKNLLANIKQQIQEGNALSLSLQSHSRYFDILTCQLIAAGEQSGKLDIMLERVARTKKKFPP